MKKSYFLLSAAGALLTAATATAQTNASSRLLPVNSGGPKTFGLVYDYASGTWTSTKSEAAAAAEVLYDNTCSIGSFMQVGDDEVVVDAGRLPSTSSPDNPASVTGTLDEYPVHSFDVAYCTAETSIDFEVSFYEQFDACDDASAVEPTETFSIVGAPGSATAGQQDCWLVTIDLGNLEPGFVLAADGDGVYDGVPSLDNFGYAFHLVTTPANGDTGPVVAGDPFGLLFGGTGGTGCGWGEGLYWSSGSEGTGIGTDDYFEIDDVGPPSSMIGCFFFGGYLAGHEYSSMFLEIAGAIEEPPPPEPGTGYCFGDGTGTACPCSNDNDGTLPGAGCANGAFASGAKLSGSGTASLSNDTLVLSAVGLHASNSGLYFQANNDLSPGSVWGDGLQCAGGQLKRLGVRFSDATGASDTSAWTTPISVKAGNILAGDTKRYQLWYRDTSGAQPCGVGVNDFNATNGYAITWAP